MVTRISKEVLHAHLVGSQLDLEGCKELLLDEHLILLLRSASIKSCLQNVSLSGCARLTDKSVSFLSSCSNLQSLGEA